jgi:hypothetical protein
MASSHSMSSMPGGGSGAGIGGFAAVAGGTANAMAGVALNEYNTQLSMYVQEHKELNSIAKNAI